MIISVEEWEREYGPVISDDEGEVKFHWNDELSPGWSDLKKEVEIHRKDGFEFEQYVWTMIDSGDGILIVPGVVFVNRLDYVVSHKPWSKSDELELIVDYEGKS